MALSSRRVFHAMRRYSVGVRRTRVQTFTIASQIGYKNRPTALVPGQTSLIFDRGAKGHSLQLGQLAQRIRDWSNRALASLRGLAPASDAPLHLSLGTKEWRDLLDAAPDALIALDERGKAIFANRQTEQLSGYSRHELLSLPIDRLLKPAQPVSGSAGLPSSGRRRDGSEFPVEV
ncbi:MAG: PAS domain S-box protein, partial [Alphaproteobacteria bacterium]|nr:PAS domain S-box protein [Alphaproteobacteria bacterium]